MKFPLLWLFFVSVWMGKGRWYNLHGTPSLDRTSPCTSVQNWTKTGPLTLKPFFKREREDLIQTETPWRYPFLNIWWRVQNAYVILKKLLALKMSFHTVTGKRKKKQKSNNKKTYCTSSSALKHHTTVHSVKQLTLCNKLNSTRVSIGPNEWSTGGQTHYWCNSFSLHTSCRAAVQ